MTSNVTNYLAHKEKERSNKVMERETARHNTVVEAETQRHNVAMEGLQAREISERERANRAQEGLTAQQHAETQRHNFGTEALTNQGQLLTHEAAMANVAVGWGNVNLGYANLAELQRHQSEVERESQRHNRALEHLQDLKQMYDYRLGSRQQDTNATNAETNRLTYLLDAGYKQWSTEFQNQKRKEDNVKWIGQTWVDIGKSFLGRGGMSQWDLNNKRVEEINADLAK